MAKLERRGCWLLIPKLETRKANRVLILNKMYEVKPTRKKSGWLICNGHSVTGGFFSIGSTSRGFIQQGELPSEYQVKIPQTSCLLRCYRIPHSNRFLCLAKPFPVNISWYYCYHWYAHPKWLSDAEVMGGSRVPVTPWVAAVGQDSRKCPRWIGSVILSSILSSTHLDAFGGSFSSRYRVDFRRVHEEAELQSWSNGNPSRHSWSMASCEKSH